MVGHAASVSAGEEIRAVGEWLNDLAHGLQFRATSVHTAPPSSLEGIERYLGSGLIRGIGPVFAHKLVEAFGLKSINDLPLSFDIGWYEQKAVLVLLVLLHLGVKNIHLGPTVPAFLCPPGVVKVIVDKWNLKPITTHDADVKAILADSV